MPKDSRTATITLATSQKRVLFDARPGETCVTGIGRYARTLKGLLGLVPDHRCWSLGEHVQCSARGPFEEEILLPALLEREDVDVFHSPLFHLPAVLPCRAVVTVHDAIPIVRPELSNEGFTRLFHATARDAVHRADRVVCPSEHAKHDVVQALGLEPSKIVVVGETPAPHFRVLPRLLKGHFFLVVGSLDARKNPHVVLDALARTDKAERPRVVFVGPSAGVDLLEEANARGVLESVERRGVVSDEELVRLYNDAIALLFPSRYEGFGLPLVEAFACGTPVISSNAGSLPEIAGDAAVFFDPDDADALAAAMKSLDEERRSDLRIRGFQRLEAFRPDRICKQLARLYTEIDS